VPAIRSIGCEEIVLKGPGADEFIPKISRFAILSGNKVIIFQVDTTIYLSAFESLQDSNLRANYGGFALRARQTTLATRRNRITSQN
jgi:hypothetical protein